MEPKKTELMNFLKKKGGLASYAEIIKAGFSKLCLKDILDSGQIQKIDRGLYRLSAGTSVSDPDLVAVSIKVPEGTICLLSALAFHEATNEIPKYLHIAIPRGTHANKINYPPVKFHYFIPKTWKSGIEKHKIGGRNVKIYSLAKTIADCFKFRNKIGIDVVRASMKIAVQDKGVKPKDIVFYSKICRVDKIVKPILETML